MARRRAGSARCISRPRARRRRSGVRSRRGAAPLVLVLGGDRVVQRRAEERPDVRDGALGHRHELVEQPVRRLPLAAGAQGRAGGRRRTRGRSRAPTARERAYLAAVDLLYRDAATPRSAHAHASPTKRRWRRSSATYPDDLEARIFYALALGQTALPTDKTYAQPAEGRRHPRAGVRRASRTIRASRTTSSTATTCRRWRRAALDAARRYADDRARRAARAAHAVAHVHARRACGRTRSRPTSRRPRRRARMPAPRRRSCTRSTTRRTPTCRRRRTRRRRRTLDAHRADWPRTIPTAGAGDAAPPSAGYYALGRDSRALRARARARGPRPRRSTPAPRRFRGPTP